jgi:hypothetical protein
MSENNPGVVVSWSGGKDSCLALAEVRRTCSVIALLTTITRDFDRISMHGVRGVLLERQAESLGIPLHKVFISKGAGNEEYERNSIEALETFRAQGIASVVFGDLFLEDIRAYRETLLARLGMKGLCPVWGRDTSGLIKEFLPADSRPRSSAWIPPNYPARSSDACSTSDFSRTFQPKLILAGRTESFIHSYLTVPDSVHPFASRLARS